MDLTLLGLNVHLDDCEDGPVTVDITARRGQLLGNLCAVCSTAEADSSVWIQRCRMSSMGCLGS